MTTHRAPDDERRPERAARDAEYNTRRSKAVRVDGGRERAVFVISCGADADARV
jgi:hypothetical protein